MSKPVHVADLVIGDWIVVTKRKPEPMLDLNLIPGDTLTIPFPVQPLEPFEPTGMPMQVNAISLPFIACRAALAPHVMSNVDVTRYVIRRPTDEYVQAYLVQYQLQTQTPEGHVPVMTQFVNPRQVSWANLSEILQASPEAHKPRRSARQAAKKADHPEPSRSPLKNDPTSPRKAAKPKRPRKSKD